MASLHTYYEWKKKGYQVKKGEKSVGRRYGKPLFSSDQVYYTGKQITSSESTDQRTVYTSSISDSESNWNGLIIVGIIAIIIFVCS